MNIPSNVSEVRLVLDDVRMKPRLEDISIAVTKSVFTDKYDQFREMLVAARKRLCLTQVDIAERLGKPQSFVSKYERGERRLDVVEFIEVSRAIGVNPQELFSQLL